MKCVIVRERLHSYAKELEKGADWDIPFVSVEIRSSSPETYVSWCNEMEKLEINSVRGEAGDEWIELVVKSRDSSVKIVFNGDLAREIGKVIRMIRE